MSTEVGSLINYSRTVKKKNPILFRIVGTTTKRIENKRRSNGSHKRDMKDKRRSQFRKVKKKIKIYKQIK